MVVSDRAFRNRDCNSIRPTGFTIFELLVAIAVISILLALIVPAVMKSRMAAQRFRCSSQLRQMCLAAANYESTFGAFPSGVFFRQIRPYAEVSAELRDVVLFACPSDLSNANGNASEGKMSFAVNDGLGASGQEFRGIVPLRGKTTAASEITDGLSNTAMIAERLSFPWYAPQSVAWNERRGDWKRTFIYFSVIARTPEEFCKLCLNGSNRPIGTWVYTDKYQHLLPPNSSSCVLADSSGVGSGVDFGIGAAAGSVHDGGAFVGSCDGAVRFVSNEISTPVWQAQGTKSGGEPF